MLQSTFQTQNKNKNEKIYLNNDYGRWLHGHFMSRSGN